MPSNELCGEDVTWVDLATVLIDLPAVDPRWTDAGLQVQAYAREVCEFARAPRALDIFPDMNRRLQMLFKKGLSEAVSECVYWSCTYLLQVI